MPDRAVLRKSCHDRPLVPADLVSAPESFPLPRGRSGDRPVAAPGKTSGEPPNRGIASRMTPAAGGRHRARRRSSRPRPGSSRGRARDRAGPSASTRSRPRAGPGAAAAARCRHRASPSRRRHEGLDLVLRSGRSRGRSSAAQVDAGGNVGLQDQASPLACRALSCCRVRLARAAPAVMPSTSGPRRPW